MKKLKSRGFNDTLYVINFICVQFIVLAVVILTALSGLISITDMSALAAVTSGAYAELGIHTGFIVWKAKHENCHKFKQGEDNKLKEELEDECINDI